MALTLTGSSGNATLDSSAGLTFSDSSNQSAAASPYVLKNRIINGDMRIDQRNAGASVTPTNGQYTLDRWQAVLSQTSKFSVQQNAGSVTPPAGFTNYLGVTSLSAYTVGASELFNIVHNIEGFNTADLGWGTANAQTVTLSFWVRSSLTGTFGVVINNSGSSRSYPAAYTISSANTWEQKSITIAGDTSGTWLTTNGVGLQIRFGLGVGSTFSGTAGSWSGSSFYGTTGATSVVGTNGATFYITGVQLEQNTTATPFERRLYNQELANCQRYLPAWNMTAVNQVYGQGQATSTSSALIYLPFKVSARVAPTGITASAAANFYLTTSTYSVAGTYASTVFSYGSTEGIVITSSCGSGLTAGNCTTLGSASTSGQILATGCEL